MPQSNSEYVTIDDSVSSAALEAMIAESRARADTAAFIYTFGLYTTSIVFFLGIFLVVTAKKLKPRIIGIVCVAVSLLLISLLVAFGTSLLTFSPLFSTVA